MTLQLQLVLALLVVAIVLFAIGRPRTDVVALLMMAALPFTGAIDVGEAIAGFADPNIVLIALLFVIGEGLVRTGVARKMGESIVHHSGGDETRLLVGLMLVVALVGSIMSSTGVVAIFIPIVLRIARSTGISPGRLMMPLSVAALCSGMMTLVATAPNLVVNGEVLREGYDGFQFFSFTPFGIPILIVAVAWMLIARRWLPGDAQAEGAAKRPGFADWIESYGLAGREYRVRVRPNSPLIGQLAADVEDHALLGTHVLAFERLARFGRTRLVSPEGARIHAGDVLLLDAHAPSLDCEAMLEAQGLDALPLQGAWFSDYANDIGMAEMIVPMNSRLVGASARHARLRASHKLAVLGVKRGKTAEVKRVEDVQFHVGDTLLVAGPWSAIRALGSDPGRLILLDLPAEFDDVAPTASRAPFAIATLLLTIAMMVSGIVSNVHAALIGSLLMGATGCIDLRSAYRSIHWPSLVLIVGMLPFSLALQRTGGVDLAADALAAIAGDANPRIILAALFAVTAILGMFISNTAVAVLMAPVALALAEELHASPHAFAMTVALGASTAFMTPVSSPVNALVVGPGGYRFGDFVRVGTPLALMALIVTVFLVPLVYPV